MTANETLKKREFRDALVIEYQNYARAISFKIIRQFKIPREFLVDLIAAANLGLVEAANKFDPSYGVDFKVYAYFRIRGEAIDFLRKNANLSSSQYKKLKALQDLEMLAQGSFHRDSILGPAAGLSKDEQLAGLLNLLAEGAIIYQLQQVSSPREKYLKQYSEGIVDAGITEKITELLQVLNEREHKLIFDYYFLDKTFLEISRELNGLSKSWMSRLHRQALRKMKDSCLTLAADNKN